ncbi:FKBP-type peptidyl-prolyl cis-trans isomerase [Microbacterium sp. zg.B48]|uniref:FKBP-type peptidyl-prolyl cis-trans isomerase n=1 Tax=unclassified Microbacterium TaxID=2609290 RepID=UPI00214AED8A|nr:MULTISPECIES: FKBP-type peptidyl-prolyl cis-trans isomerase [unclassified Microbacterium]MCR2762095.1 FKBP-type peptidyl-prolyl cis-trans isomerase [Microbacterium sp. zg.B48]MCR2809898.1 FKBP-type peptidyl-prolyl cis-trans isomerase [Microbacterium sp. zg.B185]WIM17795.1 FKBP-type peptidyl-prolyl cis-trans isomerase [Microbacterium sp. zg-B185]
MRKISASLAVLGLLSVGLVGCSLLPGGDACPRPTASDSAVTDLITVSGSTDDAPDVDLYLPFHASAVTVQDEVVGEGNRITTDSQLIMIDVSITSGATGERVVETAYDGDLSRVSTVSQWTEVIPGFEDALICATEGSRIVVALPPGSISEATATGLELDPEETAVAVIDLRKVYLAKADGADQFNFSAGLPTVVRAPDGRPGVIVPDADPPADLVVQTLKKGDGAVVTGDEPVRVHYTGLTWDDRAVFETTWDDSPQSVTLDSMIPGFADALRGQTVGSQVLVVVPPDQGYGDREQGAIPADSTLIFVVDILGLDQPATR